MIARLMFRDHGGQHDPGTSVARPRGEPRFPDSGCTHRPQLSVIMKQSLITECEARDHPPGLRDHPLGHDHGAPAASSGCRNYSADAHRGQNEGVHLGLVVRLGEPARRTRVRPRARVRPGTAPQAKEPRQPRQPRQRRARRPQSRHPLGRLVHRHPRVVHRAGHQERRPLAGGRVVIRRIAPACRRSRRDREDPPTRPTR